MQPNTALSEQAFGEARQELKTNQGLIMDAAKLKGGARKKRAGDAYVADGQDGARRRKREEDAPTAMSRRQGDIKTLKAFFEDIAALKKHKRELAEEESGTRGAIERDGFRKSLPHWCRLPPLPRNANTFPSGPVYPASLSHSACQQSNPGVSSWGRPRQP